MRSRRFRVVIVRLLLRRLSTSFTFITQFLALQFGRLAVVSVR